MANGIGEIIERIVICRCIAKSFKESKEEKMEYKYRGKVEGFMESLDYLGLTNSQINCLTKLEERE